MSQSVGSDVSRWLQQAVAAHQQGQLDEAEAGYRRILKRATNNADTRHLLGLLLRQRGRDTAGIRELQKAVKVQSDKPLFWSSLAHAYRDTGQYAQARDSFLRYLQFAPSDAKHWTELGNCQRRLGDIGEAAQCWRRALEIDAGQLSARLNLGNTYYEQGRWAEAEACYRKVLQRDRRQLDALNNLGQLLAEREGWRAAYPFFEQALATDPHDVRSRCNLGTAQCHLGQLEAAETSFQEVLARDPDNVWAWVGMGQLAAARNDLALAEQHLKRAIAADASIAEAYNSLAGIYLRRSQWHPARAALENALRCDARHSHARFNLAVLNFRSGELLVAKQQLEALLETQPHYHQAKPVLLHLKRQLLDWKGCDELAAECRRFLVAGADVDLSPFALITLPDSSPQEQYQVAEHWWRRSGQSLSAQRSALPEAASPRTDGRLRIAYLSADWHDHATAWLLARVIELHDRERFEVLGYSYGPQSDSATRRRLQKGFDQFYDVSDLSDLGVASQMRQDGIDILLEVKGHTQNARLGISALRPAPLQLNYLAYPGTIGGDFIDYVIADNYLCPPSLQQHFAERLAYLPGCYQPIDDTRPVPQAADRAELDLPDDAIVLAAFHQAYKLNPALIDVWAEILHAVPRAVLWLLAPSHSVQASLLRVFETRDIPPGRLIFAPKLGQEAHLARLAAADLVLDSFPVNGHTSAADALWAGVPVLTISGETMISRVAGSILTHIGMGEMVTTSFEDYRARAVALAADARALDALRQQLAETRHEADYFNTARYTAGLDALLIRLWEDRAKPA